MESIDSVCMMFPSCLWMTENTLSREDNVSLYEKVLETAEQVESGGDKWSCNTLNSYGTFDLRSDKTFEKINGIVTEKVNEFANFYKSNYRYEITESWYNVALEGSFQEGHVHPRSVFSGVYYVSVPPGSGKFQLYSPQDEMFPPYNITENNQYNSLAFKVTPKPGLLIIFKSSLRHMVELGSNKEPRVSLSFNFG